MTAQPLALQLHRFHSLFVALRRVSKIVMQSPPSFSNRRTLLRTGGAISCFATSSTSCTTCSQDARRRSKRHTYAHTPVQLNQHCDEKPRPNRSAIFAAVLLACCWQVQLLCVCVMMRRMQSFFCASRFRVTVRNNNLRQPYVEEGPGAHSSMQKRAGHLLSIRAFRRGRPVSRSCANASHNSSHTPSRHSLPRAAHLYRFSKSISGRDLHFSYLSPCRMLCRLLPIPSPDRASSHIQLLQSLACRKQKRYASSYATTHI